MKPAPASPLLTDLYELTMMQGYFLRGRRERKPQRVVFDMFFRRPPFGGGFAVFAGLQPLVEKVLSLRFRREEIAFLAGLKLFQEPFLEHLKDFRFRGTIHTFVEGSVVFANEPLLRVEGEIGQCQLLESLLLNTVNYQTLVATKAARLVTAAAGRPVIEFGLRRAPGPDGSLSAARAAYIGGTAATSNLLAARTFNIPASGTMAHSWVMTFGSEREAFRRYAQLYPDRCVLLVDTYDTLGSGIPNAIAVFKSLPRRPGQIWAVRLDSGDLDYLSRQARQAFDAAGLSEVSIYASNELDEQIIEQLVARGAPIDAWGVGTSLVSAQGDPALSGVYKIVAIAQRGKFRPVIKLSNAMEKVTNPGRKNVARLYDGKGLMIADLLVRDDGPDPVLKALRRNEPVLLCHPSYEHQEKSVSDYSGHETMLRPIVRNGELVYHFPTLQQVQRQARQNLERLHESHKRFLHPHLYKVSLSETLKASKFRLINEHGNIK